jgi:hypothetical protein
MKKIFTTKISLQSSNPTFCYPIIRLPRELKELAGRIANVYQTEIKGVQGFFIAFQLDKLDKFVESNGHINSESKSSGLKHGAEEVYRVDVVPIGGAQAVNT